MIMRGRTPSGPKYVEQLSGSELARKRLQTILETMAGTCRVQEACQRLGISEPRFHQLRAQMLEAAMQSMEPGKPGRKPRQPTFSPEQLRQFEEQLAQNEIELRAAQLRTEIALIMPQVVQARQQTEQIQETPTPSSQQDSDIDRAPCVVDIDDEVKKTNQRPAANKLSKHPTQRPPDQRTNT
jgi:hypothetical protein